MMMKWSEASVTRERRATTKGREETIPVVELRRGMMNGTINMSTPTLKFSKLFILL